MIRSLPVRRALVALGVVVSLVGAVATVQAAAAWTARSAPLAVAPESVDSLKARLAAEEARSADLQAQLDELRGHATDLTTALDTATSQITADSAAASGLRDRLSAAKQRLAALERLIAKTRAQAARAAANPASRPATGTTSSQGQTEHEGGDDG